MKNSDGVSGIRSLCLTTRGYTIGTQELSSTHRAYLTILLFVDTSIKNTTATTTARLVQATEKSTVPHPHPDESIEDDGPLLLCRLDR